MISYNTRVKDDLFMMGKAFIETKLENIKHSPGTDKENLTLNESDQI